MFLLEDYAQRHTDDRVTDRNFLEQILIPNLPHIQLSLVGRTTGRKCNKTLTMS